VNDYVEIPRELIEAQQGIKLYVDVMWIDDVPFLTTISANIRLITAHYLSDRKANTLLAACEATFTTYHNAGFSVKEFHADHEFASVGEDLKKRVPELHLNITPAESHVPVVDRIIRTIKERYRASYHRLPFSMWPKAMIIHGVSNAVKWLNAFPPKGGISTTYSPRTIITGRQMDYKKHCTIPFGSYVQAVTKNTPTNTPRERTIDAIFLRTLDNIQGGFEVLNLRTGKTITRHRVIEIPITESVIKRVEQLARLQGFQPHATPIFRTYSLLAGVDDAEDEPPPEHGDIVYHYDDEDDDDDEDFDPEVEAEDDISYYEQIETPELDELFEESEDESESESDESVRTKPTQSDLEVETLAEDENEIEPDDPISQPPAPRRSARVPKPRQMLVPSFKGTNYKSKAVSMLVAQENARIAKSWCHLITQLSPEETLEYTEEEAPVLAAIFAQVYNYSQGLKVFKDRAQQAAFEEMKQLHDRVCFRPINVNTLTSEERRSAMHALMLINEKRDGRMKGRAVTDGSKQRTWIGKDEAASPTAAWESIIITAVIDAQERRDVAIVDLPNAFIQTVNEKLKDEHKMDILKVKGKLADLLISVSPEIYGPYATKENGVTVLYLEILRALYGMIKSPLLFYRKLVKDLQSIGFVINPYDSCVANRMVNGKQQTVAWHVDDLKISHVDSKVNDAFIAWARDKYEDVNITKMKPSRGKVHDYLGVIFDYSEDGKVKIQMKEYIKNMLAEFKGKDQVKALRSVTTPAAEYLFKVDDKCKKLSPEWMEEFHSTVAKALFLCKRARPDIQPTVPFLCTRVTSSDEDDWKKLLRMMKYLEQTVDLELTLEASPEREVQMCMWYPDAAFAVHQDMKSHTGAVLTLGKGAMQVISAKQKLNTRSSTEAELVAADDVVVQAMWTRNFLEAQGYSSKTTIFQDNTSAILLEKNGKESSSKRTRHINIRYFYITDCVQKKYLNIEYCPTADMLGDFPSKPLLGRKFKKFRALIMNSKD
jgi:hypothetical protein